MTGPTVDNGFTKIANELLEVMSRYPWPGVHAARMFHVLLRECYGYRRKWADLSQRRLCGHSGLDRRSVRRALDLLIERGVILQSGAEEGPLKTRRYEIDSHWERWDWAGDEVPQVEDGHLVFLEMEPRPPYTGPASEPPQARRKVHVPRETRPDSPSSGPPPEPPKPEAFPAGNTTTSAPTGDLSTTASAPTVDDLTAQLIKEGFKGLELGREFMRRTSGYNAPATVSAPTVEENEPSARQQSDTPPSTPTNTPPGEPPVVDPEPLARPPENHERAHLATLSAPTVEYIRKLKESTKESTKENKNKPLSLDDTVIVPPARANAEIEAQPESRQRKQVDQDEDETQGAKESNGPCPRCDGTGQDGIIRCTLCQPPAKHVLDALPDNLAALLRGTKGEPT